MVRCLGPLQGARPCSIQFQFIVKGSMAVDRNHTRINDQIRVTEVRCVDGEGNQLGVITTEEAMNVARDSGLDLVEVAPDEKPPVCRIMDYGKFKYQKGKKQSGGKTHHTRTKELRLRPKTGKHDIDFKVKQGMQFLDHKDKVQVSVVFRGREIAHIEEGRKVMQQVVEALCAEHGKIETPPTQQGRRIVCIIAPK